MCSYGVNRVTSTLIDNIFTSLPIKANFAVLTDISDHFLLVSDLAFTYKIPQVSRERQVRLINKITLKHLNESLGLLDWQDVISTEDTDVATDTFLRNFNCCLDSSCPFVTKKMCREKFPIRPWITSGILISVNKKNQLFKKQLKNPTDYNIKNF